VKRRVLRLCDRTGGELAETLQTAPHQVERVARWYAIYTKARHEKRVDLFLRERGYDSFLPLLPRESQWTDRRKIVEWPLFPSYVFGRFTLGAVHDVLCIPGVSTLVKANGRPLPVGHEELANVRRFADALRHSGVEAEVGLKQVPFLTEGEWVRITSGPLAGVCGVVVEQRGRRRVRIGLKAIGQGFEVNIATARLQSVPAP
jgi:transcription termination/antitermination protein NusG